MKRKIFTLLLSAFFCTMVMAEAPTAVAKKAAVAPVVDGVMDAIWYGANTYNIAVPFKSEVPTFGDLGTTTFKTLWTDEGVYFFITVNDDEFYPAYKNSATDHWQYDKPELYFNVNAVLVDGAKIGGHGGGNFGKYQVAPPIVEDNILGVMVENGEGQHAFMVTEPTWKAEYFVPFSLFKDADGAAYDVTRPMGFDVTMIDGESDAPGTRKRANWANAGGLDESWNDMDEAGILTFSDEEAVAGTIVVKTAVPPVIDGVVDPIWSNANVYNIVVPFKEEAATLGDAGETTWKALWDDAGMYILVQVTDDEWFPFWAPGGGANGWEYDKPELYFDTNLPRVDQGGGHGDTHGSVQIAPDSKEDGIDGTMQTGKAFDIDYNYAYKVTDPNYVAEYFIPWDILNDRDGLPFDKSTSMGFDITMIDRDAGDAARKRVNWANAGALDENWNNMDDAGVITFDGAGSIVSIEKITVSGGTAITADGGTLQLTAAIEPGDATSQKVKWVVENGTGEASVSKDGLVSAIKDGDVLIKAMATDGSFVEGKVTVTISGQMFDKNDIYNTFNKISNWNFSTAQTGAFPDKWGGWVDVAGMEAGAADPVTEEGICVMKVGLAGDGANWHYQLNQSGLTAEANVPYVFMFKTWATADATPCVVDFEDTSGNNYNRYGTSTDSESNGSSEWAYQANIEPVWKEYHVVFDKMVENTVQKVQYMFSLSNETIYLDSVVLVKESDYVLKANLLGKSTSKVQLFPNPVQTELTVSRIATANSRVSIYNAVGQKLIEKTANGTQAKFDVANLRKGMYFVRFSDGTSEKFIKQ